MKSGDLRGWAAYRALPRVWWIAAGVLFGLFTTVRLWLYFVRHDPFWTVPFTVFSYVLLSLQLLSLGRRRQMDAEVKRLQAEQARLIAEIAEQKRSLEVR